MKPSEHPEFFRFPAPEGRSRESQIRLDAEGYFHDHGELVEHARLAQAMHTWIARHPDDGRYILTNGYDWTYFEVADAPYFVRAVKIEGDAVRLVLSDGSEEAMVAGDTGIRPASTGDSQADALYTCVKREAAGGPFDAKFSRHAQTSLAPVLGVDEDGRPGVTVGGAFQPFAGVFAPAQAR